MVTLEYRLIGNVNNPVLVKQGFPTREAAIAWAKAQGNVLILVIESTGEASMRRIFG
jgi:hypothetical protein